MSNSVTEKWIIVDDHGKRHGKPTYTSSDEAQRDLPKLQESSGTPTSGLKVKMLLQE